MVFNIILIPEAIRDIDESISWYEEQRMGLGNSFLKNTNETLQHMQPDDNQVMFVKHQSF